jgi:HlyD family secretion protein
LGAVLLAAAAFGAARAARPSAIAVHRVARQPLTQTLVVSGRVMPPTRVNIGSLVTGTVSRRLVEEGRHVRAGEVLLQLDEAEARAALQQAQAAVGQAEARSDQLGMVTRPLSAESLTQARLTYDRAERERQRISALAADGIVTASQLDDATKAVEMARSQLQSATVQQAGNGVTGVEARAARASLDQARAAAATAGARLDHTVIRAPADGVIIGRYVEAGDIVQPGQRVFELAVDGPTLLTIDPDEKNLSAISMGQAATASPDAYPGQLFPATVSFIGAAVDPQRGTVEVRLSVTAPPATLRPDMTVSVELEAGRRADALTVPGECVRDVTGRAPWVLVLAGGQVERRTVRAGLRGDPLVEILSGVGEGELVIPSSAGNPAPGTRLVPRLVGR